MDEVQVLLPMLFAAPILGNNPSQEEFLGTDAYPALELLYLQLENHAMHRSRRMHQSRTKSAASSVKRKPMTHEQIAEQLRKVCKRLLDVVAQLEAARKPPG
jgi:hypothetical protein